MMNTQKNQIPRRRDFELALKVGAAIRRRRKSLGVSMARLANEIGVVNGCILNVESGRTCPSLTTFFAIARALGISPNELLGWEAEGQPKEE